MLSPTPNLEFRAYRRQWGNIGTFAYTSLTRLRPSAPYVSRTISTMFSRIAFPFPERSPTRCSNQLFFNSGALARQASAPLVYDAVDNFCMSG